MDFIADALGDALRTLGGFGAEIREVLWLTLIVSGTATLIGLTVGIPLGLGLGLGRFRGRGPLMVAVNVGMGMPPVLAGLLLLMLLWSTGPLGSLGLLFTPLAMIIVQALLAIPIAAGVTAGAVEGLPPEAREQLGVLPLSRFDLGLVAGREAWPGLVAAAVAAFGRVVSEVGAVLVIGGNIEGETRVLTTAIVQESRQAQFGTALALGAILLLLALMVNGALTWIQLRGKRS